MRPPLGLGMWGGCDAYLWKGKLDQVARGDLGEDGKYSEGEVPQLGYTDVSAAGGVMVLVGSGAWSGTIT